LAITLKRSCPQNNPTSVDSKVMELVYRWRSKEGAKGLVPNLPMRQVYTEVRSTLPTMLEYSRAL
jgi:hypothetical protein